MKHGTSTAEQINGDLSDEIATVSPIIGNGPAAHRVVRVGAWTLTVSADGDEPRIRDIDLAERLGYERAADIRDLVKRLIREEKLNDSEVFRTVRKTAAGGRPATEFWLTEAQALKVVAKSETAKADALLDEVIRVFILARRGLLPQHAPSEAYIALATGMERMTMAVDRLSSAVLAMNDRVSNIEGRLLALEGRPALVAPSDVLIGRAEAKAKVLGPLYRAAVLYARALGREREPGTIASRRMMLDMELRRRVDFPFGRGRAWQNLPTARLGDVLVELTDIVGKMERIARDVGQGKQLPLLGIDGVFLSRAKPN